MDGTPEELYTAEMAYLGGLEGSYPATGEFPMAGAAGDLRTSAANLTPDVINNLPDEAFQSLLRRLESGPSGAFVPMETVLAIQSRQSAAPRAQGGSAVRRSTR